MPSAQAQVTYSHTGFSEPVEAQHHFAHQFDVANPVKAMSSYQKIMHQHTKQQFETATASSRRRSTKSADDETASFSSEMSQSSSISSTGS